LNKTTWTKETWNQWPKYWQTKENLFAKVFAIKERSEIVTLVALAMSLEKTWLQNQCAHRCLKWPNKTMTRINKALYENYKNSRNQNCHIGTWKYMIKRCLNLKWCKKGVPSTMVMNRKTCHVEYQCCL
jgi:hypothetical protein